MGSTASRPFPRTARACPCGETSNDDDENCPFPPSALNGPPAWDPMERASGRPKCTHGGAGFPDWACPFCESSPPPFSPCDGNDCDGNDAYYHYYYEDDGASCEPCGGGGGRSFRKRATGRAGQSVKNTQMTRGARRGSGGGSSRSSSSDGTKVMDWRSLGIYGLPLVVTFLTLYSTFLSDTTTQSPTTAGPGWNLDFGHAESHRGSAGSETGGGGVQWATEVLSSMYAGAPSGTGAFLASAILGTLIKRWW